MPRRKSCDYGVRKKYKRPRYKKPEADTLNDGFLCEPENVDSVDVSILNTAFCEDEDTLNETAMTYEYRGIQTETVKCEEKSSQYDAALHEDRGTQYDFSEVMCTTSVPTKYQSLR